MNLSDSVIHLSSLTFVCPLLTILVRVIIVSWMDAWNTLVICCSRFGSCLPQFNSFSTNRKSHYALFSAFISLLVRHCWLHSKYVANLRGTAYCAPHCSTWYRLLPPCYLLPYMTASSVSFQLVYLKCYCHCQAWNTIFSMHILLCLLLLSSQFMVIPMYWATWHLIRTTFLMPQD